MLVIFPARVKRKLAGQNSSYNWTSFIYIQFRGAMCVDDLQNRIEEAKAKGWKPFLVIGRDQKQINDLLISERSIRPATFSPFIQFSDFLQFRIFDFCTQQVL
jgi:hypothetical protein